MASSSGQKHTGRADPSHYSVLQVSTTASKLEIRRAWMDLVRIHHPDKLPSSIAQLDEDQPLQVRAVSSIEPSAAGSPTIHQINEAYAILSSDSKRHDYDRQLEIARRQRNTARTSATLPSRIVATLDLDAFHIEEELSQDQAGQDEGVLIFTYDCRCGDHYQLTGSEVLTSQQGGQEYMIVQCGGCSERIKVLLGSDDHQPEGQGQGG